MSSQFMMMTLILKGNFKMKILSIDAWAEPYGGWSWNNWYQVGEITKAEFEKLGTDRKIIRYFRDNGYIGDKSKGLVSVYDDQYNICICDRSNNRPLYAIEYGPEY